MLFLAIPLPSSHPSSPQAWHHSPEETRLLMSSGLAHPGAGLSLPAPFFPSQLLSFPADPVECFPCLPHSPCASLFPFYRGFDHLRLFNPDSKEGKVPFELLPVLCPSTLPESSSAHPLEHPSRTKPSLCRPGLQPAWAAGSAYLQAQPAFQPSAGPLQLSASCQAPEVLFKKFPAPAPTAMNWLFFGVFTPDDDAPAAVASCHPLLAPARGCWAAWAAFGKFLPAWDSSRVQPGVPERLPGEAGGWQEPLPVWDAKIQFCQVPGGFQYGM